MLEIFQPQVYVAVMITNLGSFGARIRDARKAKQMTQRELADRLLVSLQSISQWEGDHTQPSNRRLIKLAEILGVRAEWLQNGKGEQAPSIQPSPSESTRFVREYCWEDIRLIDAAGSGPLPMGDLGPETILAQRPAVRQLFAARIREDDNAPLFSHGDLVIADTGIRARPGDFVFVEAAHEEHVIFRQIKSLRRRDDGYLAGELHPINTDYAVEAVVLDDKRDRIIGVMVEHRRLRRL